MSEMSPKFFWTQHCRNVPEILLGSSRAGFKEKFKRGAILKSLPMDLNTPNSEEKSPNETCYKCCARGFGLYRLKINDLSPDSEKKWTQIEKTVQFESNRQPSSRESKGYWT